jgi:DNA-binding transcriptional ArsR family regulator
MRYEMAADCAADVTDTVTHNLETLLSDAALMLFRALHTSAIEVSAARDYHPNVSQVSFFCPVEAVALALGVHRCTVYRALPKLQALGLVDVRAHYTTHQGRTVADGSVWAVRLRPVGGCKARVQYGDLKRSYRDLGGDVEAGRTVWAAMRQSKEKPPEAVGIQEILRWALPPQNSETPVTFDCRTASRLDLEAVLDVRYAPREARGAAVDLAAQALATALSDRKSANFFRRLLWQLLRRSDAGGGDHFYTVYLVAQRASVDAQEGFARRPGALFTSRLKGATWFEEVMRCAGRVGPAPVTMRA